MYQGLKISVALASWNGAQYLEEQLESLLTRTVLPDELVISDDASRDNTVSLARQFAKKAPFPVRILENGVRVGFAKNFERAIAACEGDIICLCDQDDIWLPSHVEELVKPFQREETVLVLSRSMHFRRLDNGRELRWPIEGPWYRRWDWQRCRKVGLIAGFVRHQVPPFAGHGTAFRASLRATVLPVAADWHDFWIDSLASALGDFWWVDEVLTHHRVHSRNTAGYGHRKALRSKIGSQDPLAGSPFAKEIARLMQFIQRLDQERSSFWRAIRSRDEAARAVEALRFREIVVSRGRQGVPLAFVGLLRGVYHQSGCGLISMLADISRAMLRKRHS